MQRVSLSFVHDASGTVFVEKLIAYLPMLLAFFASWELAELAAAKLVVQRASAAAGRAAVVVLADDPVFYDGEPVGSYDGRRREDIELAAGMVLSAIPRLTADFEVDVAEPSAPFGPIDVTVNTSFQCGGARLVCGLADSIALSASTKHTYQGAKYTYASPSDLGGGGAALVSAEDRSGYRAGDSAGTNSGGGGPGGGAKKCKMPTSSGMCKKKLGALGKHAFRDANVGNCADALGDIRKNFEKVLADTKLKCVTKEEAYKALAKDLMVRERDKNGNNCTCITPEHKDYMDAAKNQVDGNQCRGFTDYRDHIYLIVDKPGGDCPPPEMAGDLLHETIHVMSGLGGTNPIQTGNNALNEAITQWWTKEAAVNGVKDAYTSGAAGDWMKCLDALKSQPGFQVALCKSYFQGDQSALSRFVLDRYKRNLGFSEKKKSDDELAEIVGKYDLHTWQRRICK